MPIDEKRPEKLTRVRIEGFRSIRTAEVRLGDITVMVGANGAGKTNFIGFLQMLSYMMSENLSLFVNERRGANSLLHFGSDRTPRMKGELEFQRDDTISIYGFALVPAAGDRLLFTHEEVQFFLDGQMDRPFDHSLEVGGFESAVPKAAKTARNPTEKRVCQVFRHRLSEIKVFHFHNTTSTAAIRGFQSMRENRFLLAQGGNLAVMLQRLLVDFERHYARIVDEMRRILPEFRDFVLEPDPRRDEQQIELRWVGRHSDATLGPDQLSDGSIRAAALLTLLLQPDSLKPGIVVIDEPELGLHPFAVGQIGRLIAEAGVTRQIIVSTQSSQLLSQFNPEDLVVVESEDGASQFRHLDPELLGGWLEAYDNDLGRLFEMNVTGGAPD